MKPVLLLDVVGLTSTALAHMPRLRQLAANGWQSELATVLPAVTCSVQSTMLTGLQPGGARDRGQRLVLPRARRRLPVAPAQPPRRGREALGGRARARGEYSAANVCWWYAMGMTTDVTVTPRPVYHADGRKSPDAYVRPPALHDDLVGRFGEFPLFTYWGPTADITSSRWIVDATRHVLRTHAPDLTMAYVPHLDYDLQRFGPTSPQADAAAAELDATLAPLLDDAANQGVTVLVVSEYGIADADRPVHLNRILRREGLLEVYVQDGKEQLDPWTSRAFAVADHQVAHVYLGDQQDPALRRRVTDLLRGVPGVDEVLDREAQARYGLDHERSGDLVVVAEPGAWFTYYFWLDDARAPEYARGVDIHRKPGYDPAELFFDPADRLAKAKAGLNLVKKKVGLRYAMSTVPLDASYVKGSHGRLPDSSADTPLVLCSDPEVPASVAGVVENGSGQVPAAAIKGLVLELQGLGVRV